MNDPDPIEENPTPLEILEDFITGLQAIQTFEQFNFWRQDQIEKHQHVAIHGEEGDEFVYIALPPPLEPTGWRDDEFSENDSNGCRMYRPIWEAAGRWAESRNRILKYAAANYLARNWYMLPFANESDEFLQRYQHNLTCSPKSPMISSRSGYVNKPVYASFYNVEERHGPQLWGRDPIADHWQPVAGSTPEYHYENVIEFFLARYRERGAPGYYGYVTAAANAVFNMDRGYWPKWEHYEKPPLGGSLSRWQEIDLTLQNPNY
jgi:hypothetical protein